MDKTLRVAEEHPQLAEDLRAQAHLIHSLGHPEHGYWKLSPDHQQEVLSRCIALIPRLGTAREPKLLLEALFCLYLTTKPFEYISRALKVVAYSPRPLQPDERMYPTTGLLGAFCNWNRESDVPLAFYFWAGVAMVGAACRYNFFIDRNTDLLRLNHYLVLVGDKATGKSTAMNAAVEVLGSLNALVWGWKPGRPLPDVRVKHPFNVRLLPTDTNQETLVRVLQRREDVLEDGSKVVVDSTGLLALDELATFLGRDTWAISKRVPFLTEVYSADTYAYHTQKGGEIGLANLAVRIQSGAQQANMLTARLARPISPPFCV